MTEPVDLEKAPTGVPGLDSLLYGGLPRGMITTIVGGPGTGKTMLATAIVARGAEEFSEPGVIVSLEQGPEDLERTLATAGIDIAGLRERGLVEVVGVRPESLQAVSTGTYSLDGLMTRIAAAVDRVSARRLCLDTVDALMLSSADEPGARLAFEDLISQLRSLGLTTVVSAQDPRDTAIGGRLVEYLSDCVITLGLELHDRHSSRSLRVVKFRGSPHIGDAVTFHIDTRGPSTMPIAFVRLADIEVDDGRITSGLPALDDMLGGDGYYRRSTVMITGGAGTGKTSLGAYFAHAAAAAGERALFVSFEEPATQLERNLGSIGLQIRHQVSTGRLRLEAVRPEEFSLEVHLRRLVAMIDEHRPTAVVLDPISSLASLAPEFDVSAMLTRLVDLLHARGATGLFTSLSPRAEDAGGSSLSSLVDTWIHVRNIEASGERNRALYVQKSRGMSHTNQVREFVLGPDGVQLLDIVTVGDRVVTGTARAVELERANAAASGRERDRVATAAALEHRRRAVAAQIEALRAEQEHEVMLLEARLAELEEEERLEEMAQAVAIRGRESHRRAGGDGQDEA